MAWVERRLILTPDKYSSSSHGSKTSAATSNRTKLDSRRPPVIMPSMIYKSHPVRRQLSSSKGISRPWRVALEKHVDDQDGRPGCGGGVRLELLVRAMSISWVRKARLLATFLLMNGISDCDCCCRRFWIALRREPL